MHLPTSNGEHCTGDGIKMGEAIGAKTLDLEWVQVHPTGLVNPKDADAKVKFLAAEALRGVGGLVFDSNGNRFANELGRRDYVTGEMWKNKAPFRLCLNKAASDEIIWHCKHYTGRGVMKYFESGRALAAEIGCSADHMSKVIQLHKEAADKMAKDPEGGPYPAYPSGRCWDEPSGKTGSGKKFYHNVIDGQQFYNEPYYAAIITPIIHYCMGGLEITTKSEVVGSNGRPIPGLYCAGECMGGVHGNNRLGGNSLLDCVVFGRVAGQACSEYAGFKTPTKLSSIAGAVGTGGTAKSALSGGSYEDEPSGGSVKAAAAAPAASSGGGGGLTLEEVAKHNTEQDCWVVVSGDVLDVTAFLPDHPGGVLAIVTFAGKDATEEFNMIHPPDVIKKYAPDAIIGKLGAGGAPAAAAAAPVAGAPAAAAPAAAKAPDAYANNFVTPVSLLTLANFAELLCCKARGSFK
jgi:predicted heme/steroid binding protein